MVPTGSGKSQIFPLVKREKSLKVVESVLNVSFSQVMLGTLQFLVIAYLLVFCNVSVMSSQSLCYFGLIKFILSKNYLCIRAYNSAFVCYCDGARKW